MTDHEKMVAYYQAGAMQNRGGSWPKPPFLPCRVLVKRRVQGDWPVGHNSVIYPGEYDCKCNQYGAVSVVAQNGSMLGLRLDEFEPIEWIENEHA